MIKTFIIDDEQHGINAISRLLQSYNKEFQIIGSAKSVNEAIVLVGKFKPDLIFLDIELKDKTGFDFLRSFDNINFQVIFVTAHDNYAIKAFQYCALHYLLKPIDSIDFHKALERAKKIISKDFSKEMKSLLYNLNNQNKNKRIKVPILKGYKFIDSDKILYLKANVNYTDIYFTDGHMMNVPKTLKWFDELLNFTNYFYRTHKSYIINIEFIEEFHKEGGGQLLLLNNIEIPISIRRKNDFIKKVINR